MSSHDKDKNLEQQEFERYLAGDSELSDLYRGNRERSAEQPGAQLDETILAAARREVGARPTAKATIYAPFSNHYLIPLSSAATIVVVVALLSYFPEQPVIQIESEPSPEIATSAADQTVTSDATEPQLAAFSPEMKRESDTLDSETTVARSPVPEQRVAAQHKARTLARVKTHSLKAKQGASQNLQQKRVKNLAKNKFLRKRAVKETSVNQNFVAELSAPDEQTEQTEQQLPQDEPAAMDSLAQSPMSAAVFNPKLVYSKLQWQHLSAIEWQRRITEIYDLGKKVEAQKIIAIYNKKFPEFTFNITDLVDNPK